MITADMTAYKNAANDAVSVLYLTIKNGCPSLPAYRIFPSIHTDTTVRSSRLYTGKPATSVLTTENMDNTKSMHMHLSASHV